MNIHNVMEELVFAEVEKVCASIKKDNMPNICVCPQCQLDAACYALNRLEPRYIVSSRGILREDNFNIEHQQKIADITTLIYQGLKQVSLNQRPGFDHSGNTKTGAVPAEAYFNIPVIIGRIFNGRNFEPISDTDVELYSDEKPVVMKDANWQNPCRLIQKTEGTFTFWPESLPAKKLGEKKLLNFSIKAQIENAAPLVHHFEIPIISEKYIINTVAMNRTHKIADLYMFDIE
jgi:competence protein ComFB